MVADPGEPFLWQNNLNPLMTPCLKSSGGKCQDAAILVEELAVTIKLAGAREGAAIEQPCFNRGECNTFGMLNVDISSICYIVYGIFKNNLVELLSN